MKTEVLTKNRLDDFLDFPDRLYEGDQKYTPFMRSELKKNLIRLLFEEKSYTGLIATDNAGRICGRLIFTIDKNKQLKTDRCGFFYLYECVNDPQVSHDLLSMLETMLRQQGAEYISGPYWPFDRDNRRGFLYQGFDTPPVIFNSYNPEYYNEQMTDFGMKKEVDALSFTASVASEKVKQLKDLGRKIMEKSGYRVDHLNLSDIEKDICDVQKVIAKATTDINYQEAPTAEELRNIFHEWKRFLWPELIAVARRNEDDEPLGVLVAIPDYNVIFRKIKGRLGLKEMFMFLREKKKIRKVRGLIQYVIPEYQNGRVLASMFSTMAEECEKLNITEAELGTIMENNTASVGVLKMFADPEYKVFRVYCKDLRAEAEII